MKKNIVTTKKQQVVGSQKYINSETGEVEDFLIVEKNVDNDFNFYKIWLQDILHILDSLGSKKIRVLTFLLKEMRTADNTISVNYRYIADQLGISTTTVSATMNELIENNIINRHPTIRSLYMMNPDIIAKGSKHKRQAMIIRYNFPKDDKEITIDEERENVKQIADRIIRAEEQDDESHLFNQKQTK